MPATIPLRKFGRFSIENEFPFSEGCIRFDATDTSNEKPVDIFQIGPTLPRVTGVSQGSPLTEEVERRVRQLSKLQRISAVGVKDFFVEDDRYYLVCERSEGEVLAAVISRRGSGFPLADVIRWADDLLESLIGLHSLREPQVHGSVRPSNIVLRDNGTISLLLAPMLFPQVRFASLEDDDIDGVAGSLAYSPLENIWGGLDAASQKVILSRYDEVSERILKEQPDPASDIYSLGATLYRLATGLHPVDPLERSIEMIEGHPDPLKSPNQIDPTIPPEISDVIMKSLEIKRNYRFDSAAIMRQVLKGAVERVKERDAGCTQEIEGDALTNRLTPNPEDADGSTDDVARRLREADEKRSSIGSPGDKPLIATGVPSGDVLDLSGSDHDEDLLGILSPPQAVNGPVKTEPVNSTVSNANFVGKDVANSYRSIMEKDQVRTSDAAELPEPSAATSPPIHDEASPEKDNAAGNVFPATANLLVSDNFDDSRVSEDGPGGILGEDTHGGSGFPKGLAALGAAAVVLCSMVIGWVFLGNEPPPSSPPAAVSFPAAEQQPEAVADRVAFQPDGTQVEPNEPHPVETTPASSVTVQPQPQKAPVAVPAKPRKPEPGANPTPAPKKRITVDDLINDN